MSTPVRLQKFLSQCGISSRRKAEELIRTGRIQVDGITVTAMGMLVDPEKQLIHCDGRQVLPAQELHYYLLNKPKGYVTTLSDPQGRPVVSSLLKNVAVRVFPVGRLDLDTEGALLLTNDGELAQRIQHPSNLTKKTYEAFIRGHLSPQSLRSLEKGILIDEKKTAPCTVRIEKTYPAQSRVHITLHEGRKHQVKKMFAAVGHPVLQLKRLSYGRLSLGPLPIGQYKKLEPHEIKKIFL